MPDRSEAAIQRAIVGTLERLGYTVIRVQSGTRGGGKMRLAKAGTPDLCVLGPNTAVVGGGFHGFTCWMEVKTQTGAVSDAQIAWLTKHRDRGHRAVIVRSVEDALRAVGRLR